MLSNQVRFSLVDREPERELVPWAQQNGRVIIAYSPLGQGLLSGKYQDSPPSNLVRRRRSSFSAANRARLAPLIAALREIGDRHSATRGAGVSRVADPEAERRGHPGRVERASAGGERRGGRHRPVG